jgi:hypothetical protein
MEEVESLAEKLRIFEEKEKKRIESINKSKKRPEYREKVKEYNKNYYKKKKEQNKILDEST